MARRWKTRRRQWKPYVPVGERHAQTQAKMQKLRTKGLEIQPVVIEGRKIARTFWGQAWCDHLESFSDFANRLPRGRSYVRSGAVCHLEIAQGEIRAMVSGSRVYNVTVAVKKLPAKKWKDLKERCAGQIGSLLDLLQGKLSKQVMAVVSERDRGLFPRPGEITLRCDCPDWAVMCKHVAAVLYGVGARLDEQPELLFVLRGVDHEELISAEAGRAAAAKAGGAASAGGGRGTGRRLAPGDLAEVFGIEMAPEAPEPPAALTGAGVKRLRAKLGLSQSQLARLLGVSAPSVGNWERTQGGLRLQAHSRDALREAAGLTVQEARKRLDGA